MATESIRRSIFANVIDNKAVVIGCIREESHLVLHGSTLQASVASNSAGDHPKTITFYPKQDEEGIIALVIHAFTHHSGGKYDHARFNEIPVFLKLTWKQDGETKKPFIDLENPWYPADRIGQIQNDHVEVSIKGKRFANHDHAQWNFNEKKNCPMFVQDGDLLCRYLWGTASAADVLHVAVEKKLEPSLRVRVEKLDQLVGQLKGANRVVSHEVDRLNTVVRRLETDNEFLESSRARAADAYQDVIGMLMKSEWLYRLLKRLPTSFRPKTFNGFIEAMDSVNEPKPATA